MLNYRLLKVEMIPPVFEQLKFGEIGNFFKVYISISQKKRNWFQPAGQTEWIKMDSIDSKYL